VAAHHCYSFVMMVSDSHKVMTTPIVMLPLNCCLWRFVCNFMCVCVCVCVCVLTAHNYSRFFLGPPCAGI
jgi:hypothetical protein